MSESHMGSPLSNPTVALITPSSWDSFVRISWSVTQLVRVCVGGGESCSIYSRNAAGTKLLSAVGWCCVVKLQYRTAERLVDADISFAAPPWTYPCGTSLLFHQYMQQVAGRTSSCGHIKAISTAQAPKKLLKNTTFLKISLFFHHRVGRFDRHRGCLESLLAFYYSLWPSYTITKPVKKFFSKQHPFNSTSKHMPGRKQIHASLWKLSE